MKMKLVLILMTALQVVKDGRCSSSTCTTKTFNKNEGVEDRVLESRIFKNLTMNDNECFMECTMNCRCLSYNICDKQCQLNDDTEEMRSTSLKIKPGCSYYDLIQVGTSILPPCCLMSNPCFNGGTCSSPVSGFKNKRRFSCLCKPGYYGNLCETTNPRSCADFMTEPVKPLSGEYKIIDDNGIPYAVFCDFDSELNFAWTMLLSFSRDNALSIQKLGLLGDLPVNEDALNWQSYRLSLSRMTSIRERSTHWRATCGFDLHGVDYQEYVRVDLTMVDFSAYYFTGVNGPNACKTIEYMNIWGTECHNCNFALYQHANSLPALFLDWSKSFSSCTFDLSSMQRVCSGSHAGLFYLEPKCFEIRSKCQIEASSTTQNWFGTNIEY